MDHAGPRGADVPEAFCGRDPAPAGSLFDGMERGEFEHCFIEANMCEGGCINGPGSQPLSMFPGLRPR